MDSPEATNDYTSGLRTSRDVECKVIRFLIASISIKNSTDLASYPRLSSLYSLIPWRKIYIRSIAICNEQ